MSQEDHPHPLAHTKATRMLADGLSRTSRERGLNQQAAARQLGYKTSVVLSHMAAGRVPIPIDRAAELAQLLDIEPNEFLLAVLEQRHPDVDFRSLFGASEVSPDRAVDHQTDVVAELELVAGCPFDALPFETISVLREVVGDRDPRRRWLSLNQLSSLEIVKRHFPRVAERGLTRGEAGMLNDCLTNAAKGRA